MQLVIHVVQNRHWRAKDTLGLFKNRELTSFKIVTSLVCFLQDNAPFALQCGSFVPRESLAAKGLLLCAGLLSWLASNFHAAPPQKYYSTGLLIPPAMQAKGLLSSGMIASWLKF